MHAMAALCPRLWPIRPIWRCCMGTHASVDTHKHTHTRNHAHTLSLWTLAATTRIVVICNSEAAIRFFFFKKSPAVTFIGGPPEPKRSSLQTKGQVCGGVDISTSPSRTHSLQRQKDCVWLNRGRAGPSVAAAV